MAIIVPVLLLVLVALATRYGRDSRDGFDWAPTPHAPRWTGDIVPR